MGAYPHPIIAKEGWPFVAASLAAALLAHWIAGPWWAAPVWLVVAFMLQFFRDPPRAVPQEPKAVVSPADGRVVAVERARDPYLARDALKMSVFMNVFNVHSNRSPVDGEIRDAWHFPGSFINAALSKASLENERAALWIRTTGGADVTCVQIAGLIARRILCYAKAGQRLARGERYGFIRFGSRVDVYLPPESRPVAAMGDKVYAAETILARLP
ncbi:MAG: phosphatidylserine decarboxylase [Betaproteobacteria bacterium]|nr:phosphatidylserine decarboxylase [Betaproteobacteria bacterium]